MSYKSLLVHGGADAAGEARVKAALGLGAQFEAALTVLGAEAWWPYPQLADSAFYSPELIQTEREAVDKRLRAAKAAYTRLCAASAQPHTWREAAAFPDLCLVELAKGADLVVAGRPKEGDNESNFAKPGSVVMQAGAPVLVLPTGVQAVACGTVVVAWKDTREARRALIDSLPFLQAATRVVLLQVRPADGASPRQHDVLERLRRHGVEATPDFWVGTELGDGGDLIQAARHHHADMIVAGAYGHSRVQEWAFGGVTKTLLDHSPIPVLLSR